MTTASPHIRIFKALTTLEDRVGTPLYLIGGYVRDLLQQISLTDADIDIVLEGDAEQAATIAQVEFGGSVKSFQAFGTAKLINPTSFPEIKEIDFARCRKETYTIAGALPHVEPANLQEDLRRRDFTINAIAVRLADFVKAEDINVVPLIDPFGGQEDLRVSLIRVLHEKSFLDDPTRLFRAVRYCMRIKGCLEPESARCFEDAVRRGAVSTISLFRVFSEIRKMCAEPYGNEGLLEFAHRGLLDPLSQIGVEIHSLLSNESNTENRYTHLLKAIFTSLNSEAAALLAKELNMSKKTVAEFRS